MIPFNPDAIAEELSKRGHAWADTDAALKALDEATKSVLSECMVALGETGSIARAEMLARTDPVYKQHLEDLADARQAANRARVNYDTFQAWIDLKRSEQATQREQMKMR
jgi:hypothetical protein